MNRLKCSNLDCESYLPDGQVMFNINCTVDEERSLTENLKKVEPEYFECVFCHSEAIEDHQ